MLVKNNYYAVIAIYGMHGIHATIILIFASTKLISFVEHILKLYNLTLTFFSCYFLECKGKTENGTLAN